MKSQVLSAEGKKLKEIELPKQFEEAYRPDIILRATHAYESRNRQAYGTDPSAGLRTSAKYMGKRSSYGSWANRGMSRIARIRIKSGHMTGTVRKIPQARKGRASMGPNAEKIWAQKINAKERRLALRSAISATASNDAVAARNHYFNQSLPIVMEDKFAALKKTTDVVKALKSIGLERELSRASEKKVRAGIGKTRGRKYRTKKGPLVVVSEKCGIMDAAKNIAGIDVALVEKLNINQLAPGGKAGRLAIWTEGAIKKLESGKLFI